MAKRRFSSHINGYPAKWLEWPSRMALNTDERLQQLLKEQMKQPGLNDIRIYQLAAEIKEKDNAVFKALSKKYHGYSKFLKLFTGEWQELGYKDEWSAAKGLVMIIQKETNDQEQTNRIFHQSKLYENSAVLRGIPRIPQDVHCSEEEKENHIMWLLFHGMENVFIGWDDTELVPELPKYVPKGTPSYEYAKENPDVKYKDKTVGQEIIANVAEKLSEEAK